MWWMFLPALGISGIGAYLLLRGDKIVLYDPSVSDALININTYIPSWIRYPVSSAQDVLNATSRHNRISRWVLISHGGPDWALDRALSPQVLGQVLGPRLIQGAIFSIAGCSTARSPHEPSSWTAQAFEDGGADSYLAATRDVVYANGGPWFGEGRGHGIRGHTLANSSGRYAPFNEPGRHTHTVRDPRYDWRQWISYFTGQRAARWILGIE
jgi:hypothetical protein